MQDHHLQLYPAVAVASPQFQYRGVLRDQMLEISFTERSPEQIASAVVLETRFVVVLHGYSGRVPQPMMIPVIMRIPTLNARQLLAFPPLLTPIRL